MNKEIAELKQAIENKQLLHEHKKQKDKDLFGILHHTLFELKNAKPNDRSDEDRRYAILITDFEKIIAYFDYHFLKRHEWEGKVETNERST